MVRRGGLFTNHTTHLCHSLTFVPYSFNLTRPPYSHFVSWSNYVLYSVSPCRIQYRGHTSFGHHVSLVSLSPDHCHSPSLSFMTLTFKAYFSHHSRKQSGQLLSVSQLSSPEDVVSQATGGPEQAWRHFSCPHIALVRSTCLLKAMGWELWETNRQVPVVY